jgi:hypothetical protein
MVYRMRVYKVVRDNAPAFHRFFRERLLPVQLRRGTEDGRVVAVWEYDDRAAYERIELAVRNDPDSAAAQEYRRSLEPLFTKLDETFMVSTLEG